MRPVVLLSFCTQVVAMGFGFEGSMALLQTTVLHQAARRSIRQHQASSADQTKQLIHLLDVDNDGKVSWEEVNTFASANGLDPSSIAHEFGGIDTNGNGILEQQEVASLLASDPEQDLTVKFSGPVGSAGKDNVQALTSNVQALTNSIPASLPVAKEPLLKLPPRTDPVGETTSKLVEQPPQGDTEEYFAEVPVESAQTSEVKKGQADNDFKPAIDKTQFEDAAVIDISKDSDSDQEMSFQQGHQYSEHVAESPAVSSTKLIAEQLNSEVAAGAQAMTFQAAASTLRANASSVLLHAQLKARAAAQKAATEVTMKNLKEINKLQSRASKAEMRAAALRARANLEMKEAYAAVAVASGSMSKIGERNTTPTTNQAKK